MGIGEFEEFESLKSWGSVPCSALWGLKASSIRSIFLFQTPNHPI